MVSVAACTTIFGIECLPEFRFEKARLRGVRLNIVKFYEDVEIADADRFQKQIGALSGAEKPVKIRLSAETESPESKIEPMTKVRVDAEFTENAGLLFKRERRSSRCIGYLPRYIAEDAARFSEGKWGVASFKGVRLAEDRRTFAAIIDVPVLQPIDLALDAGRVLAGSVEKWSPPPLPPGIAPELGEYDDPVQSTEEMSLSEGQYFVIRYTDIKGRLSTRRITAWGTTKLANGAVGLVAQCHERRAKNVFRLDRIKAAIDYSGVVHQPADSFLRDVFGLPEPGSSGDHHENWRALRACMRPHVQIMAALSRSNGTTNEREIQEILPFAGRFWPALNETDHRMRLVTLIRRSRPVPEVIPDILEELRTRPRVELVDSLQACKRVLEADGVVSQAQEALFNLVCEDLIEDMLF